MAKSATFKCAAWKGASEVSITVGDGSSATIKPDESGSVKTTNEAVITALRSDPLVTEVDAPKDDGTGDAQRQSAAANRGDNGENGEKEA